MLYDSNILRLEHQVGSQSTHASSIMEKDTREDTVLEKSNFNEIMNYILRGGGSNNGTSTFLSSSSVASVHDSRLGVPMQSLEGSRSGSGGYPVPNANTSKLESLSNPSHPAVSSGYYHLKEPSPIVNAKKLDLEGFSGTECVLDDVDYHGIRNGRNSKALPLSFRSMDGSSSTRSHRSSLYTSSDGLSSPRLPSSSSFASVGNRPQVGLFPVATPQDTTAPFNNTASFTALAAPGVQDEGSLLLDLSYSALRKSQAIDYTPAIGYADMDNSALVDKLLPFLDSGGYITSQNLSASSRTTMVEFLRRCRKKYESRMRQLEVWIQQVVEGKGIRINMLSEVLASFPEDSLQMLQYAMVELGQSQEESAAFSPLLNKSTVAAKNKSSKNATDTHKGTTSTLESLLSKSHTSPTTPLSNLALNPPHVKLSSFVANAAEAEVPTALRDPIVDSSSPVASGLGVNVASHPQASNKRSGHEFTSSRWLNEGALRTVREKALNGPTGSAVSDKEVEAAVGDRVAPSEFEEAHAEDTNSIIGSSRHEGVDYVSSEPSTNAAEEGGIRMVQKSYTMPAGDKYEMHKMCHLQGRCKPCAFYYNKKKGCKNGVSCEFCHHEDHGKQTLKQWKKHQQKLLQTVNGRVMKDAESPSNENVGFSAPNLASASLMRDVCLSEDMATMMNTGNVHTTISRFNTYPRASNAPHVPHAPVGIPEEPLSGSASVMNGLRFF